MASTIHARHRRGIVLAPALLVSLLAGSGCGTDIFDTEVALMPGTFALDFGSESGTIPTVACDPQAPAICGQTEAIQLADGSGAATIAFACDPATARCFAQSDAHASYTVAVLQDETFQQKVERRATFLVRKLDFVLTLPVNTTTFAVPAIDVYLGPPGALLPSDAGVLAVGSVASVPAATPIGPADARHLMLADGTPARDFAESNIKNETPFLVIVATSPRLDSGAAIPAGLLTVNIQPVLTLGLR